MRLVQKEIILNKKSKLNMKQHYLQPRTLPTINDASCERLRGNERARGYEMGKRHFYVNQDKN